MPFITLEGLDGSGKDTALDAIETEYPDAIITSEPSELWTGRNVRRCLSDESTHPLMDFYMFMADRIHHIEKEVKPHDTGIVVSGRYADSTRAYQPVALVEGGVFDSPWHAKSFIEQTMAPWDYEPDLTLYLDISPEEAVRRASGDEKYEKLEFLRSVSDNYDAIADAYDRVVRIDAEQRPEAVRNDVLTEIEALLE